MEIFIGRQPIFDLYEHVIAYELFYRNNNINKFNALDSDAATVDVIVNTFLSFGIEEVANSKRCFINFTENLLMGPLVDFLNPHQVVIEILENVPLTPLIIQRVRELKKRGFGIALDDFILDEQMEIYYELFSLIDYIKVDFLESPIYQCIEIANTVKQHFPHISLLAEKVETREQLEVAKYSGYHLFQGYFFEKPQIMKTIELPSNTIQCFKVIYLLNVAEPDINAIAKVIEQDVSLSYKLLHLINTHSQPGKAAIESIKQAILLLGLIELNKWLYILAMKKNTLPQNYELHLELIHTSLFRAKVCELLAKQSTNVKYAKCFLVGMFSLMDALLQKPMLEIVQQLPLSKIVSETITGGETKVTPFLQCSIALKKTDFDHAEEILKQLQIHHIDLQQLYNDAFQWADNAVKAFKIQSEQMK